MCSGLSHLRHADMTLTHALKQKHRQVHIYATANPNSAAMGNRWLGGGFFEPGTWPRAALGSCQLGGRTWNRQGPSNYCSWEQTPHTRLQRGLGGAKTADIANVFKSRRGKGRPGLSFFHGFLVRQIVRLRCPDMTRGPHHTTCITALWPFQDQDPVTVTPLASLILKGARCCGRGLSKIFGRWVFKPRGRSSS